MGHWHFYFEDSGAVVGLGGGKPFGPFDTEEEALDELQAEFGMRLDDAGYVIRECDGTRCFGIYDLEPIPLPHPHHSKRIANLDEHIDKLETGIRKILYEMDIQSGIQIDDIRKKLKALLQ